MTTEADVEQARVRVRNLIASQVVSLNEQEALEVLLSAAMEGLKVPRLKARARVLKARLPDGMKKCTIVFKSCPLGHGRLIAKNWIDDGCQTCALRKAESERDALRAQVAELEQERDEAISLHKADAKAWVQLHDDARKAKQIAESECTSLRSRLEQIAGSK